MNWLRCSSADAGNSKNSIFRPWDANFRLKFFIIAATAPVVSLPWQ
jgi:hypothetical protein